MDIPPLEPFDIDHLDPVTVEIVLRLPRLSRVDTRDATRLFSRALATTNSPHIHQTPGALSGRLGRSVKGTHSGRRGSRSLREQLPRAAFLLAFARRRHLLPQGSSLDCFRDSRHRPLACSSSSESCGGRNRTCDEALNRRPPVPAQDPPQESVRTAGFEPAISCARGTRPVSRDTGQAFLRPEDQCAQPESNRHALHGEQEGCHYIMGANHANQIVKERQSTGPDSKQCFTTAFSLPPRYRSAASVALSESGVFAARRPVPVGGAGVRGQRSGSGSHRELDLLDILASGLRPLASPHSGTRGTRTLTRLGKNQGCCR